MTRTFCALPDTSCAARDLNEACDVNEARDVRDERATREVPAKRQSALRLKLRPVPFALALAHLVAFSVIAAPNAHAQTSAQAAQPAADIERFAIRNFLAEGNSLLSASDIQTLTAPFTGPNRNYGDIQKALEALERAYRSQGYAAVQVFLPEQTVDSGTVKFRVVEAKVTAVNIKGNDFSQKSAIMRALPSLKVGQVPNTRDISANVQAANENPNRQVDVVLGSGAREDEVVADIEVKESKPWRVFATLDNTGNDATGKHRLGLGAQHSNLWGLDHVGTLQFTTSVEKPSLVKIWSAGYRLPVYAWRGSVDVFAAKSTVSSGTTATVAGPLTFTGKGDIVGLRYNQQLPRVGEYSHKLTAGWDYRAFKNDCALGVFGAAGCGGAAYPLTLRPLSLAYSGELASVGRQSGFNVSVHQNLGGGQHGSTNDFNLAKGGGVGNVPTFTGMRANYTVLRGGVSHAQTLPADFQLRAGLAFQTTGRALPAQEQFGIAGSTAVRGFTEREVSRDRGYYANLELYGPDWGKLVHADAAFRLVAFADFGSGKSFTFGGTAPANESIASVGLGFRASFAKNMSLRADLARVTNAGGAQGRGDSRAHFLLTVSY
jgi:hemolysin activation/secretion protein